MFENGGRLRRRRTDPWTDEPVDGRTDDVACLYYKLTNDPKGSGELKSCSRSIAVVLNMHLRSEIC